MDPLVILGPTASGKSDLAMEIARRRDGEIVSIDSRQIYRKLDIGTAKPTAEERAEVPHHMIDILDLEAKSDANWFAAMALESVGDIISRGKLPILAGGAGLYFRVIFKGLFEISLGQEARRVFAAEIEEIETPVLLSRLESVDSESASRIHKNDRYRIARALEVYELTGTPMSEHFRRQKKSSGRPDGLAFRKVGLDVERSRLHERINLRTVRMFENGWIGEVQALLSNGADPSSHGMRTLGYPEVVAHIAGEIGESEMVDAISTKTRQYAKRQMTWFRKETDVEWIDPGSVKAVDYVLNLLDRKDLN